MNVRLLKEYKFDHMTRTLKKGTEIGVENKMARDLIAKGIAVEMDGPTKDEKKLDEIIKAEDDRAAQGEANMITAVDKKLAKKK